MSLAWLALLLAPAPSETPRAFVERIYSGYGDVEYSPFAVPERFFAAPLVAAMEEDSRLSYGEVGFLDGDPLCQCQDPTGLETVMTDVRQPTPRTASARIRLRLDGGERRDVRLKLVRTDAGWRIADVGTPDSPSLLSDLRRSNRRRR